MGVAKTKNVSIESKKASHEWGPQDKNGATFSHSAQKQEDEEKEMNPIITGPLEQMAE